MTGSPPTVERTTDLLSAYGGETSIQGSNPCLSTTGYPTRVLNSGFLYTPVIKSANNLKSVAKTLCRSV